MPPTLKTLLAAVWDMGKALWNLLGVPLLVYSLVLVLLTWSLARWLWRPPALPVAPPTLLELSTNEQYRTWLTGVQSVTHRFTCGVGFPVFTPNAERNAVLLDEYHHALFATPPQTCDDQRTLYEQFLAKGDVTP